MYDNGYFLAVVLLAGATLSWLAQWLAQLSYAGQHFLVKDGLAADHLSASLRTGLLPQLLFASVAALICSLLDPLTRRLLGGGLLMVQVGGIAISCGSLLLLRSLRDPGMATGQLRPTPVYRYRAAAAQVSGLAIIFGVTFGLTGDIAFLGSTLFSSAAAAGYYRRSRQAAKRQLAAPAAVGAAIPVNGGNASVDN